MLFGKGVPNSFCSLDKDGNRHFEYERLRAYSCSGEANLEHRGVVKSPAKGLFVQSFQRIKIRIDPSRVDERRKGWGGGMKGVIERILQNIFIKWHNRGKMDGPG